MTVFNVRRTDAIQFHKDAGLGQREYWPIMYIEHAFFYIIDITVDKETELLLKLKYGE